MLSPRGCRAGLLMLRGLGWIGVLAGAMAGRICVASVTSEDANTAQEYLIDVWDTEDNLPSSTVTAIAQTPEGYLWVGTYNGLSRFDGVRFVNFDPVNTPAISHARIQGLSVDASGTLWINTFRGGLTSYRDGVFRKEWPEDSLWSDLHTRLVASTTNKVVFVTQFGEVLQKTGDPTNRFTVSAPPPGARPIFQCTDAQGKLWFLSRDGKILRFYDNQFNDLPPETGLDGKRVITLAADSNGIVWAGAENEIARWTGIRFENMTPTNGESKLDPVLLCPERNGAMWVLTGNRFRKMEGRRWTDEATRWRGLLGWAAGRAMGVHEDFSGGMWFNHYGNGLFHITPDGKFERLTGNTGLPGDRIGAWFQGLNGSIWLGVDRGGLARLREKRFHVIGQAEGLPARTALSICQDNAGAMWIGTAGGGLCRLENGKMERYRVGGNASANFVFSIFPRHDGGIWTSATEGEDLLSFRTNQLQRAPWETRGVKSIMADRDGRVWVGTKSGLGWYSATDHRAFGTNDGVSLSAVRAIVEAPNGIVWSGADDGTLYRCEPDNLRTFHPKDNLAHQAILSLLADADGTVWIGTFRGGLLRFKNGKFSRFTEKQGLPADVVSQIQEDDRGRLWLGTHKGLCCASKASLTACAEGTIKTVDWMTFGRLDGLPTLEFSDGYQPASWRSEDGRLWFTTVKGVVSINPEKVVQKSLPPQVIIEELRVDGQPASLEQRRVVVPPGYKQFEFRYTALSFDAPDKTRFRYRMDGLDKDWVEAGDRRTAQYGHLPPRSYKFRVIATDNEGAWTGAEAVISIVVQPYFYQTKWFIALISALILGTVALTVRAIAAKKYRREMARLEQQHAIERDRARIAKDIHDDIGAGLTQITLLSELARRERDETGAHLDRIAESARQLTRAMDEIVWAVDPQHDTFAGLMDYVSAFAEDFLRTAEIRCRMDLPNTFPEMRVDAEMRYNLFLAIKEALNNIVKHARATEVWLRLRIGKNGFAIIIEDNGQGLPVIGMKPASADRLGGGAGLPNIEKRLAAIGGSCVVESVPGQGTRIELRVRINHPTSPVVAIGRAEEVAY